MGKRKRHDQVIAEGGGPNPVEDEGRDGTADSSVGKDTGRTRTKKEVTASPANMENPVNGESKEADSSQKVFQGTVMKTREGRKRVTGKAAAHQAMKTWSSTQEIIALSELVKLTDADAGQYLDKHSIDWEQLAARVGQRLDCSLTRTQMYEKARRLKERYTRTHTLISKGTLNSFKNEDDEKMYKLSQQIWGSLGANRLKVEEHDLRSHDLEKKSCDVENVHQDATDVEVPGVTMEKDCAPKKHRKDCAPSETAEQGVTAAHEQANPDLNSASQSKIHGVEGDAQKTFEVFHAEHQALLKELEKNCAMVLHDMQVKFLSMMNNTVRGSQFPWIGGGGCVPSLDLIPQAPLSWDKLVDKCLSTSTNKLAAFENLYEQWQQQRLQELKLTSMKLHLMLEDCKMEQEKLEKQVSKS